ncbi:MAG: DUF1553 domain-containing protein, partial [Planctomycetales bacterium]|nr:DUF1553 domain-containing protein [Planctomycetales bacterium]
VNRIWQWHFGQPLVGTPGDFGLRSDAPTHPELLDYLAYSLYQEGDSLKQLHRLIVLSQTYRQSSADRTDALAIDPGNQLLWRYPAHRVAWEVVRDSLLAAAGQLEPSHGGPSISRAPDDVASVCRTIYLSTDRQDVSRLARYFDAASPDFSVVQRSRTGVAQQHLFFLNSPFVMHLAEELATQCGAAKLLAAHTDATAIEQFVQRLFQRALSREPGPDEQQVAMDYLAQELAQERAQQTSATRAATAWSYGYGEFDEASASLRKFTPLPHFNGEAYQGGHDYPDARLHYARLTRDGGHVGIDHAHAVVRRWTVPADGTICIQGALSYRPDQPNAGDGVRGFVLAGRQLVWSNLQVLDTASCDIQAARVAAGDTIDFVVDCRDHHTCDQFNWAPVITLTTAADTVVADAHADFSGPVQPALSAAAKLAHILLQTNERLFIE